jgi:hypothetical protein
VSGDEPRDNRDAVSGDEPSAAVSSSTPPAAISGEPPADEPPPILGSWRRLYVTLLLELALTVLILYALARWAA